MCPPKENRLLMGGGGRTGFLLVPILPGVPGQKRRLIRRAQKLVERKKAENGVVRTKNLSKTIPF